MGTMYFDVWAADDLLGTSLGELTEATQKHIHVVDNQPGSGSFRINRNSDQVSMLGLGEDIARPNLIRVRLDPNGPYAFDSTAYKFCFFIEEGGDTIVSTDEEGGEVIELSGRSGEVILERAVVDWEPHFVDDIGLNPYYKTTLKDNQVHLDPDIVGASANAGTPGGAMRILVRNAIAMTPSAIPEINLDFNINIDSNSDPWEIDDGVFDFDVGTDLLTALSILVEGGLWYKFLPSFHIQAWDNSQGTDQSGSVTFEKGVNIRESGQREIHASPAKSRALVRGTNDNSTNTYIWATEDSWDEHHDDLTGGGIEDAIGVRQGFVDYPNSPTKPRLGKVGQKFVIDRKNWHDGSPTVGVIDTDDFSAFNDYHPGDTVGLVLPDVPATAVIAAIDLIDTDSGEYDPVITFVSEVWRDPTPNFTQHPADQTEGGSAYSIDADPSIDDIPVQDGQILLIWVSPPDAPFTVNGGAPSGGVADGGLYYEVGPSEFTLLATGPATIHWFVVQGSGEFFPGA